jgi:hypothetical protein
VHTHTSTTRLEIAVFNKLYKYGDLNVYELPIFLDVHKLPFSEDHLKELSESPTDEFGVRHVNLFYNKGANVCFCLLDAPDTVAVENHHDKAGVKCEWITEVSVAKLDNNK